MGSGPGEIEFQLIRQLMRSLKADVLYNTTLACFMKYASGGLYKRQITNFCPTSSTRARMKRITYTDNPDQKDWFILIKYILRMTGISLKHHETVGFKIYSVFVLLLNGYPVYQLIGAFRYLENAAEVFEFSLFETVTTLILIKSMVLVYNRFLMAKLLNKLQSGVFLPNTERGGKEEQRLIDECVEITEKQAIIYWLVVTLTVVFALLDALYSRITHEDYHDWKFEYGKVTMFNVTYSPNYDIASLYQNLSWFPMSWMFAISDLLPVTVLAHITCQLKILQNSIRRIMSNSYKKVLKDQGIVQNVDEMALRETDIDASKIPWKYVELTVREAIEYHLAIIEIAEHIENTFNLLILMIVLSGILMLGGLLYKPTGLHFGGVMCILCEIITISYWGNEVSLESQQVLRACYEVNFVGADLRLHRALFLIMERSKRPIIFTAGKFSQLSLATFLWIARASYSYLMILRRMNDRS